MGSAEENRALSERRAESVKECRLARFPILADRLMREGPGAGRLLIPTPDETRQLQNHRVQVLNLGR